jgi:hypothetical protein
MKKAFPIAWLLFTGAVASAAVYLIWRHDHALLLALVAWEVSLAALGASFLWASQAIAE